MRTLALLGLLLVGCGGSSFRTADPMAGDDAGGDALMAMPTDALKAPDTISHPKADAAEDDGGVEEAATDAGTLPEAAPAEASVDAGHDAASCPCVNDLSDIGLGDFTISFTIKTNSTTPMAILNQRQSCDESHPYWDVHTGTNGAFSPNEGVIYIEVGDGSSVFDYVSTQKTINDGQNHKITIERTQGGTYFTLTVDGVGGPQGIAPLDPLGGGLPTLSTGTDVCSSNGPIAAELTNVCIQRCGK